MKTIKGVKGDRKFWVIWYIFTFKKWPTTETHENQPRYSVIYHIWVISNVPQRTIRRQRGESSHAEPIKDCFVGDGSSVNAHNKGFWPNKPEVVIKSFPFKVTLFFLMKKMNKLFVFAFVVLVVAADKKKDDAERPKTFKRLIPADVLRGEN